MWWIAAPRKSDATKNRRPRARLDRPQCANTGYDLALSSRGMRRSLLFLN